MYKLLCSEHGHITINLAIRDLEEKMNEFEKDGYTASEDVRVIKIKEGLFGAYVTMHKN